MTDPRFNVGATASPLEPFLRRLSAFATLKPDEIAAIERLSAGLTHYPARHSIIGEGQVGLPLVVTSGWVCRERHLRDGRRQIVSFMLPGDTLHSMMQPSLPAACGVFALTPVTLADATVLVPVANDGATPHSPLSRALRLLNSLDDLLLRDQIVRLGAQTAYERMVHLFLEIYVRLNLVGLAANNRFAMPLKQEVIANALGLSIVHVNRVLQQIRRDKLLRLESGIVTVLDKDRMEAIADWSPLTGTE